jgi:transposase-like protein
MRSLWEQVKELWCVNFHSEIMWPFEGRYLCRVCQREFPVEFERTTESADSRPLLTGVHHVIQTRA